MANPTDMGAIDNLKFITRYEIEPVIVGEYTLQKHLEEYYGLGETKMQEMLGDLLEEEVEVLEDRKKTSRWRRWRPRSDKAPVVKFINGLLTDAVLKGVSDIHIEPYEKEVRIRYRIDGSLQEVMKPPMKMKAALTSRIKILADLNIAERESASGRSHQTQAQEPGRRFSGIDPPGHLRREDRSPDPGQGKPLPGPVPVRVRTQAEKDFMCAITNPYGMVLVTGPTGSGKTTTLYSALSRVNAEDVNIMTAEDPVEYNLHGINQVQVRPEIGMSFAAGPEGLPAPGPEHHHGR